MSELTSSRLQAPLAGRSSARARGRPGRAPSRPGWTPPTWRPRAGPRSRRLEQGGPAGVVPELRCHHQDARPAARQGSPAQGVEHRQRGNHRAEDGAPSRPDLYTGCSASTTVGPACPNQEPGQPGGAELEELGAEQGQHRRPTGRLSRHRSAQRPYPGDRQHSSVAEQVSAAAQPAAPRRTGRRRERQWHRQASRAAARRPGRRTGSSVSTTSNHTAGSGGRPSGERTAAPIAAPNQAHHAWPPALRRRSEPLWRRR